MTSDREIVCHRWRRDEYNTVCGTPPVLYPSHLGGPSRGGITVARRLRQGWRWCKRCGRGGGHR